MTLVGKKRDEEFHREESLSSLFPSQQKEENAVLEFCSESNRFALKNPHDESSFFAWHDSHSREYLEVSFELRPLLHVFLVISNDDNNLDLDEVNAHRKNESFLICIEQKNQLTFYSLHGFNTERFRR